MNSKTQENKSQLFGQLYIAKLKQLNRATVSGNRLRRLVLQMEAEAISEQLLLPVKSS